MQMSNAVTSRPAIRTGGGTCDSSTVTVQRGGNMKKVIVGMLAILMLAMTGCGGGSVEVVVPVEPSITLNPFSQDRVSEFIFGSVDFYAPDSDIDSMTVVAYDARGIQWSRTNTSINLPDVIRGTIPFSIDYNSFPSDFNAPYTFSVYLTDFNGMTSNQAVGTFFVP